jgi:predicted nucleotidyltransferase component of viral defense system
MNIFEQHEIFEIEVLENLKNARLLEPLVFGGGSMLRLCHELKRFSVDLDFWMLKKLSMEEFFYRFKNFLGKKYDLTDAQIKHFTLLFEIRSSRYPRRLKIEIRKEIKDWDFQEKIAYSKFSACQVLLKAFTLEQTMKNKIAALMARNEIRDAFDIEFLLRQGISLPELTKSQISSLIKKIDSYKPRDFKVKLGSVLETDIRQYYISNQFQFLKQKLQNLQSHLQ